MEAIFCQPGLLTRREGCRIEEPLARSGFASDVCVGDSNQFLRQVCILSCIEVSGPGPCRPCRTAFYVHAIERTSTKRHTHTETLIRL